MRCGSGTGRCKEGESFKDMLYGMGGPKYAKCMAAYPEDFMFGMEEEGIKLTKQAAQELIDSVADKADHPNILSAVSGIFQSKYDKAGRLILKSEHFLGKGNK